MSQIYSIITGTGSFVPTKKVDNSAFMNIDFYDSSGKKIEKSNEEIVSKFKDITTISERRYAEENQVTSDLALIAAKQALESSNTDGEELDYIIFAHNMGETKKDNIRMNIVPSLAARLKSKLRIKNPYCVAYDCLFGCPGWIQAVIQADYYIKSGDAKKVLVVGAEILSRISDPHDRDSMIFADGAGAIVMEGRESEEPLGLIGHISRSDAIYYVNMLYLGYSYNPELAKGKDYYLKMNGRKLYQYALTHVPSTVKKCLDKLNMHITDINKVLIHQANGKMDDAIMERIFKLYGIEEVPEDLMPMTISWLGNSSVATVPTLLDLVSRGNVEGQEIVSGDNILMVSVGAGMNINCVAYRMP